MIPDNFITDRLTLNVLSDGDAAFIFELLNTPGWLTFIGDRKIRDIDDAKKYIDRINQNVNTKYFGVFEKHSKAAIGIISFIRRDYLDAPDIGFAFLPKYNKRGYAFEAATAVLSGIKIDPGITRILATTVPENTDSVSLLTKLGFEFWRELEVEKEKLLVYRLLTREKE